MKKKTIDVTGIGNAIVDVLASVEDSFLDEFGLVKGSMTLIDETLAEKLYSGIENKEEVSGGSTANTIAGLAYLGNKVAFIGKVGDDALGSTFDRSLSLCGVQCQTGKYSEELSTARCIILVTPDAQRTMCTSLGIAGNLEEKDIDKDIIESSRMLYIEGYLWDRKVAKEAILKSVKIAKESGCMVSLSLSDSFCVDRHRKDFLDLIENGTDIVFANENEIISIFETSDLNKAVSRCKEYKNVFAITCAEKGSVLVRQEEIIKVNACKPPKLVDTTGAGDMYAAGFLHGYMAGRELHACGTIGASLASKVISQYGARLRKDKDDF
ncbi:MAG TPA: adenosine kinase [Actinobacteria bacterium]|nr:adenosine kinase [Actinomycetota bacterium]